MRSATRHPLAALALTLGLGCGFGPGRPPARAWIVMARLEGASPEEVERQLLDPIESALASVPGVEHLVGLADDGVATVSLGFRCDDPGPLREALPLDVLPEGADVPELRRVLPSSWFVVPAGEVDDAARRLVTAPGVTDVTAHGSGDERVVARVDPDRLARLGLRPADVAAALAGSPPGLQVRPSAFGSIEVLATVVVGEAGDAPVRLRDVASLERVRGDAPRALRGGMPVGLLEVVASDGRDLGELVGGESLAGWTRVEVHASGPWAEAFPGDVVVLESEGGGAAWVAGGDALGRVEGVRTFVRRGSCGEVAVLGDDLRALDASVSELRERLERGGLSTWPAWAPAREETVFVLDRERAAAMGVDAAEVLELLSWAGGRVAGAVAEGGEVVGVVVQLDGELGSLRVGEVALGDVARWERRSTRAIPHLDGRRGVQVAFCGSAEDVDAAGLTGEVTPSG